MKNKKIEKILIIIAAVVILVGTVIMFGDRKKDNSTQTSKSEMPEANNITEEIINGVAFEQTFKCSKDKISNVSIVFTRAHYFVVEENNEEPCITIELIDGENILVKKLVKVNEVEDQHRTFIEPDEVISGVKGKDLTLKVYTNAYPCSGIKIMMQDNDKNTFKYGNMTVKGTLCFAVEYE